MTTATALAGACLVAAPIALWTGCAAQSNRSSDAPNAGLDSLAGKGGGPPTVKLDGMDAATTANDDINLSEVLDRIPTKRADRAPRAAPGSETAPPPTVPTEITRSATRAPVTEDPAARVTRLAGELRSALVERGAGKATFADAAAMVALDAVHAGNSEPIPGFSPGQRRALDAFRSVVRAVTLGSAATGDPRQAADAFTSAAAGLESSQGVHVRRAALCTRVAGFGRYETIGRTGFVAGTPVRFLVYTELDRFSHRPARTGDPGRADLGAEAAGDEILAVELTQELSLWHDADGSAQWRMPEQTVVEVSRNRRHDFYLVQHVDLPANLSVGKYNLKISVKDRVSGATDEAQIPIVIVADPGVALAPGAGSR